MTSNNVPQTEKTVAERLEDIGVTGLLAEAVLNGDIGEVDYLTCGESSIWDIIDKVNKGESIKLEEM